MAKSSYDRVQISLHWLASLLIAGAFGLAWSVAGMSLSPQKLAMVSWHKWFGLSLLFLTAVRLSWRLLKGAPPVNAALPRWQKVLATAVHHGLYLLMFLLPLSGWLMVSALGGDLHYLGVLPLPALMPENEDVGLFLREVHEVLAGLLVLLIALHVAGGVKHYLLDHDDTLARMLPFLARKSADRDA